LSWLRPLTLIAKYPGSWKWGERRLFWAAFAGFTQID